MKKAKNRQKKLIIRNRLGMISIGTVTVLLLAIFVTQANSLKQTIAVYDARAAALEEQIAEEEERTEEIEETKEQMQTDEYAEEVARNRLGLVKENEIVFQEQE